MNQTPFSPSCSASRTSRIRCASVVLVDVHARPDDVEKLVLRDDAAAVLDEVQEELEGLRREVQILRAVQQTALSAIEGKIPEPKNLERQDTPAIAASADLQDFVRPASRPCRNARSYYACSG